MDQLRTRLTERRVNTETGEFSGYGAVFGNLDSHGDRISRGAFTKTLSSWKASGRFPHMRLMHGNVDEHGISDSLPIGIWTDMREDSHGLFVRGKLLALDTDYGRRLLSLMNAGALDGLSIGYSVVRSTPGTSTRRFLEELRLVEISVVDDPSNYSARISSVSAVDDALSSLRQALGGKRHISARYEAAGIQLSASLRALAEQEKAKK
jgi:HK97 family phage prohead protease